MLAESRAEQEAEQNRSLGRLVLQHFNAWAQMQGLTGEEMLAMQLDISEKYGLIEENAAGRVNAMASNWTSQLAVMRGEASSFTDGVMKSLAALPSEKRIKIIYETSGRPTTERGGGFGGGDAQATGTAFALGGTTLVGEFGPELVHLPRGARVISDAPTRAAMRGGYAPNVTINVTNTIIEPDPETLIRGIEQHLRLRGRTLPSLGA